MVLNVVAIGSPAGTADGTGTVEDDGTPGALGAVLDSQAHRAAASTSVTAALFTRAQPVTGMVLVTGVGTGAVGVGPGLGVPVGDGPVGDGDPGDDGAGDVLGGGELDVGVGDELGVGVGQGACLAESV
jgi:hypothetical protein